MVWGVVWVSPRIIVASGYCVYNLCVGAFEETRMFLCAVATLRPLVSAQGQAPKCQVASGYTLFV